MTGQHQRGNLLCKRTCCTMPGTLMASVLKGLKLQRGTRRQNSSSCVRGIDSKNTVNKLTANTGQEQLCLLASKIILMQSISAAL